MNWDMFIGKGRRGRRRRGGRRRGGREGTGVKREILSSLFFFNFVEISSLTMY